MPDIIEVIPEADMSTTVTSKGQVTIPKPVRDLLGITPGVAVEFNLEPDGRVVLTKAGSKRHPPSRFARLRGAAGNGMSTDQIMGLTRGTD